MSTRAVIGAALLARLTAGWSLVAMQLGIPGNNRDGSDATPRSGRLLDEE